MKGSKQQMHRAIDQHGNKDQGRNELFDSSKQSFRALTHLVSSQAIFPVHAYALVSLFYLHTHFGIFLLLLLASQGL